MPATSSASLDIERWRRRLLAGYVDPRVADIWSGFARRSVRIELGERLPADHPAGSSKFFSIPDYRLGPREPENGQPNLTLLAQIDLANISDLPTEPEFPKSGLLQFFYDVDAQPWGYDPKDSSGFLIRYLEQIPVHADAEAGKRPGAETFALKFTPIVSLPDWWWMHDYLETGSEFPTDRINDFRFEFEEEIREETDNEGNLLGGWYGSVQNPMELQCQLVSRGIYCGSGDGYASEQAKALAPGAADWRLLLQLESNEKELGWLWGDVGKLYFFCRQQDIAERRFDRAWVILQCT